MEKSKAFTFIGFAIKARKVKMGVNAVKTLKKAELLILCHTATENTLKEAVSLSNKLNAKLLILNEKELEKKYEKMLEQKVKLCEDVDEALMKLSQTERYILIERYIVGTKAFIVARVLGYEQSRFFDLERMALENFDI